ncbi:MAG: GtrA family protein [Nitrospirae bacterium]|nr:GtrA family protein [Nitrospirota bacterium]
MIKSSIMKASTVYQFARFALVGVLNTGIDFLVLNVETLLSGLTTGPHYAAQKAFSYFCGVVFSYYANKRWTFRDSSREGQAWKFAQFIVVSLVGMAVNVAAASFTVSIAGRYLTLPPQVMVNAGALAGTAAALLWNFIGYKLWVFRSSVD